VLPAPGKFLEVRGPEKKNGSKCQKESPEDPDRRRECSNRPSLFNRRRTEVPIQKTEHKAERMTENARGGFRRPPGERDQRT